MKQEILIKLKSAEADTADRVAKAREDATRLVQEARRQAADRIRQAEEAARTRADQFVASARAKLEKEREQILAEGRQKEAALRKHFEAKSRAAVETAVKTFEDTLNA